MPEIPRKKDIHECLDLADAIFDTLISTDENDLPNIEHLLALFWAGRDAVCEAREHLKGMHRKHAPRAEEVATDAS